MQRSDHLGAFTHGGCYAFDGTGAHVTNREHAGEARLQRMVPFSAIASRAYKAFPVQCHVALRQPVRVRVGTDEQKQVADRVSRFFAAPVTPADAFEVALVSL